MLKSSVAGIALISLAATIPQSAVADSKDAILGAIAGAVVTNAIRNDQERKRQQQRAVAQPKVKKSAPVVTLNGTYSRAERMEIQSALNAKGFPAGVVDGALGPRSRNAISQFQASIGETPTGQLTRGQFAALTMPAAVTPFGQPQLAGARPLNPNEVMLLQQSLMQLGLYRNPITGVNDVPTQQAALMYLNAMGRSPANTTPVQTVVMASGAAGFQTPPYLLNEAQQGTMAAFGGQQPQPFGAPQQPFGTPQQGLAQPQQAFGTQPQQGFAPQPQGQVAPGQQAPAGTLVSVPQQQVIQQPQQQPLFAAPTQQAPAQAMPQGQQQPATTGVQQQQPLFAAPQQAVPGAQPQQAPVQQQAPAPQPQGGTMALFASGTAAPAPTQQVAAQPQSGLDIFSPTDAAGTEAPAAALVPTQ